MINNVIKFQNGIVLVFDEEGEQLPEYQGRYEEVKAKILARAPKSAKFFHVHANAVPRSATGDAVPRKDW